MTTTIGKGTVIRYDFWDGGVFLGSIVRNPYGDAWRPAMGATQVLREWFDEGQVREEIEFVGDDDSTGRDFRITTPRETSDKSMAIYDAEHSGLGWSVVEVRDEIDE